MTVRTTLAGDRVRFEVHVIPRSGRSGLAGTREGALVVRVTAPPVEGAANEAVTRVLADALGVARGAVVIERGGRGRRKLVSAPSAVRERLVLLGGRPQGRRL